MFTNKSALLTQNFNFLSKHCMYSISPQKDTHFHGKIILTVLEKLQSIIMFHLSNKLTQMLRTVKERKENKLLTERWAAALQIYLDVIIKGAEEHPLPQHYIGK